MQRNSKSDDNRNIKMLQETVQFSNVQTSHNNTGYQSLWFNVKKI